MVDLVCFTTARFDPAMETPNPINPIAGEGVLKWLREKFTAAQYEVTEPDAEDWGWYMYVSQSGVSYLVGASGEPEGAQANVDWTIQVHKRRSLMDRISGRNRMTPDDPLVALIERNLRDDAAITGVEVERNA